MRKRKRLFEGVASGMLQGEKSLMIIFVKAVTERVNVQTFLKKITKCRKEKIKKKHFKTKDRQMDKRRS